MVWRAYLSAAMMAADATLPALPKLFDILRRIQHQAGAELSGSECARVGAEEIAMPRQPTGGVEDKDNVDDM
jgi:hypothetical protein